LLILLSALRTELKGIENELLHASFAPFAGGSLLRGRWREKPFSWVISGIGRKNAEWAVEQIAAEFQVDLLLGLGFAGGLSPGLEVGDLVACRMLRSELPAEGTYEPDEALLNMSVVVAKASHLRIHLKDCLTVSRILSTPQQKRRAALEYNADIVDMENYWIAKQANLHGLNFLAVRAISDSCEDWLPDFSAFQDSKGQIPVIKGLQHFALHPRECGRLPRLFQNSQLARKSLIGFLHAFYPKFAIEMGLRNYAD
jgi:adenosylhomocysteine nucleosidase